MKRKIVASLIATLLLGSYHAEGQETNTLNLPQQTFHKVVSMSISLGQMKDEIEQIKKKVTHHSKQRPVYDIPLSGKLQDHIWSLCKKYDMDYELILGLIKTESNYNAKEVSYNGTSMGLMQLNHNTYPWIAREIGITNFDVYNPFDNASAGIWYLDYLRQQWINKGVLRDIAMERALLSYNKGLAGARRLIRQYGSRSQYTDRVYENKHNIERSVKK